MSDDDSTEIPSSEALKELADVLISWHGNIVNLIDEILNSDPEKVLKIANKSNPEEGDIEITGDKLAGFRAGLHVCKLIIGDLPFTLEEKGDGTREIEGKKPEDFGNFS